MEAIKKLVAEMRGNPKSVRFADLRRVCDHYFGKPRTKGSHQIYKMRWPGDPRINIQNDNGGAKAYQVKQVLQSIGEMEPGD